MEVSSEAWMRWQSCIQKLWKDYEFPAKTREALNGVFALFRGEGSTFRIDTPSWWMVLDVLRTGDDILDIISITLASRQDLESKIRVGWVITARCPVHQQSPDASQNESKGEVSNSSELFWYRIEEGGRVSSHCCQVECVGPFKPGSWRLFDTARRCITMKTLGHEVIRLRSSDNSSELKEKETGNSELKAQIANITREKEELQVKYDSMNGLHTEQAHDLIEIQAKNRDLMASLAKADPELSKTKAKLAAFTQTSQGEIQKRLDASTQLATTLNLRLHEAVEEIQHLRRGSSFRRGSVVNTGIGLQQQAAAHEAATSIASNVSQWSSGNARRAQSLSIHSRPPIEVVDLTSEAGPAESLSKGPGHRQWGIESETEVSVQLSSLMRDRRKQKRETRSEAPNDKYANDTHGKRRRTKGRRHWQRIKTELEA